MNIEKCIIFYHPNHPTTSSSSDYEFAAIERNAIIEEHFTRWILLELDFRVIKLPISMDETQTKSMDVLPQCLILDILQRLPLKTLLICSRVCKSWLVLLAQLQLAKSPTCLLNRDVSADGNLYFGWIETDVEEEGSLRFEKMKFDSKTDFPPINISNLNCGSSCNGLVCFTGGHGQKKIIWVCNPVLREWIPIQRPAANEKNILCESIAFGLSPKSNQYKLLCILQSHEEKQLRSRSVDQVILEALVYTLGTGKWRSLEHTIRSYSCLKHFAEASFCSYFNAFVNGSVHSGVYGRITFFNFDDEKFGTLSVPPRGSEASNVSLGVLNGCLSASMMEDDGDFYDVKIWCMKKYGVRDSWTLMLVFSNIRTDVFSWNGNRVLVYDGEDLGYEHNLLFSWDKDEIMIVNKLSNVDCYNTKKRKFRCLNQDSQVWSSVTAYNPSFVSLRDVAKGEPIFMVQSRQC